MTISVSSTKTNDKIPSEVLTLDELKKIVLYIPPEVLFETVSFAYWNQKLINSCGELYLDELKALDNNTQRYIVFCWFIGCHLWKWNESIFGHEIVKPFCDFDKKDWDRAYGAIMSLISYGFG